jgi:DeoR/GlpR family transcriptional regulator of sugar metabolism
LSQASESKRRVAERAAKLVTPGSRAILGGGTTAVAAAAALAPDLVARVITPNPVVASALVGHPSVDVLILGGRLFKHAAIVCGAGTAEAAANISADLYLFGVDGVHPEEGLATVDPEHAALDRILAGRAADSYVLASAEKLGTVAPYRILGVRDVTGIVTDAPVDDPVLEQLRERGANIFPAP